MWPVVGGFPLRRNERKKVGYRHRIVEAVDRLSHCPARTSLRGFFVCTGSWALPAVTRTSSPNPSTAEHDPLPHAFNDSSRVSMFNGSAHLHIYSVSSERRLRLIWRLNPPPAEEKRHFRSSVCYCGFRAVTVTSCSSSRVLAPVCPFE